MSFRFTVHGVLISWKGVSAHTAAAQQPVAHSPINVRLVTGQPPPAFKMAWSTIFWWWCGLGPSEVGDVSYV